MWAKFSVKELQLIRKLADSDRRINVRELDCAIRKKFVNEKTYLAAMKKARKSQVKAERNLVRLAKGLVSVAGCDEEEPETSSQKPLAATMPVSCRKLIEKLENIGRPE